MKSVGPAVLHSTYVPKIVEDIQVIRELRHVVFAGHRLSQRGLLLVHFIACSRKYQRPRKRSRLPAEPAARTAPSSARSSGDAFDAG
jgi:hypothetical protein